MTNILLLPVEVDHRYLDHILHTIYISNYLCINVRHISTYCYYITFVCNKKLNQEDK